MVILERNLGEKVEKQIQCLKPVVKCLKESFFLLIMVRISIIFVWLLLCTVFVSVSCNATKFSFSN